MTNILKKGVIMEEMGRQNATTKVLLQPEASLRNLQRSKHFCRICTVVQILGKQVFSKSEITVHMSMCLLGVGGSDEHWFIFFSSPNITIKVSCPLASRTHLVPLGRLPCGTVILHFIKAQVPEAVLSPRVGSVFFFCFKLRSSYTSPVAVSGAGIQWASYRILSCFCE